MPVDPPGPAALDQVSKHYGLDLSPADVASFEPAVDGLLASWDAVERLYAENAPQAPDRPWKRPTEADNPLGAWYVTTSITEREDGPLAGRSVVIKDNTAVAGVPMMNGSSTLEGFVPARDATVVSRLLDAGATIIGKAVCEDLCFSGGSHTSRTGPVRNPWDTTRSAGGSSSGSAALLAAGMVDIATGGDQGGSVRIPAAYCGVVGHKPTHGLVPYTGAFPIEQTIDHLGPMARTVADVALTLTVIAGLDGLDPRQPADVSVPDYAAELGRGADGLRVGVVTEGFGRDNSEAAVDATVRAAVETLARAGMGADEVSVPWHLHGSRVWDVIATEGATAQMVDGNGYGMNWQGRYDPDLIHYYGGKWRSDPAAFSETVKLVLLAGRYAIDRYHGRYYAMARELAPRLRTAYDQALARFDVLVMPTLPVRATPLPGPGAPREEILARGLEMIGNTAPFDVTGAPRLLRSGRAGRRASGRDDDHRATFRRRHRAACGASLRAGGRGFPCAADRDREEQYVNGVHDLGGTDGLGRVVVPDSEPVFRAEWEKAAFAMFSMCFRAGFFGVDEFRFGIEQMAPGVYLLSPYYEHWVHTVEHYGQAKGVLDLDELDRRTQYYLEHPDAPLPEREDPDLVTFVEAVVPAGAPAGRESSQAPMFKVGDKVTVRADSPTGHTRRARYIRGRTGEIVLAHGTFIYPDSAGNGHGDAPEHVYTVKFTNAELWGPDTAEPNGVVYFDVWEPYIVRAQTTGAAA